MVAAYSAPSAALRGLLLVLNVVMQASVGLEA